MGETWGVSRGFVLDSDSARESDWAPGGLLVSGGPGLGEWRMGSEAKATRANRGAGTFVGRINDREGQGGAFVG